MSSNSQIPIISELIDAGVGAIEIICQVPTCKKQSIVEVERFNPRETVITIAAKARCTSCKHRNAEVYPVWDRTEQFQTARH